MKNKLFLALSLLTAGLNATFLENTPYVSGKMFSPETLLQMKISAIKLAPFAALATAGAAYEYSKTPVVQLTKMQQAQNFFATHKVATGAGLAAVAGLGLAYKYRKNLFGKAKAPVVKHKRRFATNAA